MAETDGQSIFAVASSPVAGVIAGFVFTKQECITSCHGVWNKDAGGAVTVVGWFLAAGYEVFVRKNSEMAGWLLVGVAVVIAGLLLS